MPTQLVLATSLKKGDILKDVQEMERVKRIHEPNVARDNT